MDAPSPRRALAWEPERARALGDDVVELWEELLRRLPDLPVGRATPAEAVRDAVVLDVPEEALGDDTLVDYLRRVVLDHSIYPGHPGFMAYITASGTVPGAAADLLAAALNQNLGGWLLSPAATEIENALTRWLAARFGLPDTAGGLMTSGGAAANFIALKTARDSGGRNEIRAHGIGGRRLVAYASEEAHVTIARAADMAGIGMDAVRAVPVNDRYEMDAGALRDAVERDVAEGYEPFVVVATAGTTATGAVDPLVEIGDVCRERGLWFHVDAAYGGPAILTDDLAPLLAGIDRADSITVDPHKWLYTPQSGGCLLVARTEDLAAAWEVEASYVHQDRARTSRGRDLRTLGPQFSRSFQGLKVWVSLLAHGRRAYAERISHDAALTRYLASLVEARDDFELMAPVTLSICCFRYVPEDLGGFADRDAYLDALNERILTEAQLDGRVFYSNAVLRGSFCLRTCIVNYRTEAPDVERVLEVSAEIGERLHRELRSGAA
ncbi:MAG: aminotransferase class V-fold PLP-dependent enzyme [Actinomycetota bacterium]|nr:aminotransferase class V-fold PLP-dependent enzyme [Actinomycetota bacterium]